MNPAARVADPRYAKHRSELRILAVLFAIPFAVNRSRQHDFAAEWAESLRVKHAQPLGEDEIARILDEKGGGR
jgi:hypothetical protein